MHLLFKGCNFDELHHDDSDLNAAGMIDSFY